VQRPERRDDRVHSTVRAWHFREPARLPGPRRDGFAGIFFTLRTSGGRS
jgi:hypothetical protein